VCVLCRVLFEDGKNGRFIWAFKVNIKGLFDVVISCLCCMFLHHVNIPCFRIMQSYFMKFIIQRIHDFSTANHGFRACGDFDCVRYISLVRVENINTA